MLYLYVFTIKYTSGYTCDLVGLFVSLSRISHQLTLTLRWVTVFVGIWYFALQARQTQPAISLWAGVINTVVERRSLAGELSLSHARPSAMGDHLCR